MKRRLPWIFLGLCAVVAALLAGAGETGRLWMYPSLGALCLAAVATGFRVHRPRALRTWVAFGIAISLFLVGDVAHALSPAASPSASDAIHLAGYPFLLAGLAFLTRRRGVDMAIDAGIVGACVFVLVWTQLAGPGRPEWTHGEALVASAFPAASAVLLIFIAGYLLGGRRITRAGGLVVAGMAALVVGDASHVFTILDGAQGRGLGGAGLLAAYALWGASALHSQAGPGRLLPTPRIRPTHLRIALIGAGVVLTRVALGIEQLDDRFDRVVLFFGISAVSILALRRALDLMRGNARLLAQQRDAVAERARAASLLEATLDATADGLIVTDCAGVVTTANHRAAAIWQRPHSSLLGLRLGESPDPPLQEPAELRKTVEAILAKPESESFDTLRLHDGRTIERYSAPQRLGGEIVGRVWSYRDLTQRRRAEESRQASEQRFRETLENVALVAASIDARGVVTFANDFLLELTGWSREEVIGQDWFARFDHDPAVRADYFDCMAAGEIRPHFESALLTRGGERRVIRWSSTLQRTPDGVVEGIVTIGEDVTERHDAEEQLRLREEHFRSLIEHATDIITVLELDGTIRYESPSVEHVLGWRPDDLIGRNAFELIHPEDAEAAGTAIAAGVAGGDVPPFVFRFARVDGSWRTLEAVGAAHQDEDGTFVVVNSRDVTERRELEEKLLHSQKLEAVGRLAGGVAHDFNNLLTAIGGYTEFLLASLDEADVRRADAVEIARAAERAKILTRQLLAFSRRQVMRTEVLDAGEVVAGLENLLAHLLGADVRLTTSAEEDCLVEADRGQLEQVLTNLAVNARDAMPEGGRLTIDVRRVVDDGAWVELAVADSGTGIDAETLEHVFEPFFTTKSKDDGTGLGLSTVYGIVHQSGGTVTVTSEVGAGSTFHVRLPLKADAVVEPAPPAAEPPRGAASETILLVEDEDMIRRLVNDVLSACGYTVLDAASGEAALELLRGHDGEIDLLLTDVVMPGLSGPALAEIVAVEQPSARVLFMSGYTRDARVSDAGAEFLAKPFAPRELVAKVGDVLAGVRV